MWAAGWTPIPRAAKLPQQQSINEQLPARMPSWFVAIVVDG